MSEEGEVVDVEMDDPQQLAERREIDSLMEKEEKEVPKRRRHPRPRKTSPGLPFDSVGEAVEWILRGRWVWLHGKPVHPGWAGSWHVHVLALYVRSRYPLRRCLTADGTMPYVDPPTEVRMQDMEKREFRRRRRRLVAAGVRFCRKCLCTDDDCSGCIERTGEPCHWVEEDLCSACETGEEVATNQEGNP